MSNTKDYTITTLSNNLNQRNQPVFSQATNNSISLRDKCSPYTVEQQAEGDRNVDITKFPFGCLTGSDIPPLDPLEVWFKMNEGKDHLPNATSITSSNGLYTGSFQTGTKYQVPTWMSSSYTTGSYSLYFDATSDYITPPLAVFPTSEHTEVTIAFWARMRGDMARGEIQGWLLYARSQSGGYNLDEFIIRTNHIDGTTGWWCGNEYPSSGPPYDADYLEFDWEGSELNRSTLWHHWAFTKDVTSGEMKIYIDGDEVASATGMHSQWGDLLNAKICAALGGSQEWAGNLSDFAIWPSVLSGEKIEVLYNNGLGKKPSTWPGSLVIYPCEDGTGTNLEDTSGNGRDGTITNSHWALSPPNPQPRTFVDFPGLTCYPDNCSKGINAGFHPNFGTGSSPGPFSVAVWARWGDNPAAFANMVQGPGWMIGEDDDEGLIFKVDSTFANTSFTNTQYIKEWNHYVGTWDNATIKLYVNGVEMDSTAYAGSMISDDDLLIGVGTSYQDGFEGQISDVRIYPGTALSSPQVLALYNNREILNTYLPP